jgi:hypothetical protein
MSKSALMMLTLLLLWLVVLVPMIFRRVDDRAQERSVRRFGRSMGLLNRRHAATSGASDGYEDVSYVQPRITAARDELFVTGSRGNRVRPRADVDNEVAVRRPIPAAQEAQMYPVDRNDMSDARRQMMARRRRSLTILSIGSVLTLLLAFTVGGALIAMAATVFTLGLGGYVYFLRNQALHDRDRREHRQERSVSRRSVGYDATEEHQYFEEPADSVVRLDDDHVELHNLDTIDLTGLYSEQSFEPAAQRRAS